MTLPPKVKTPTWLLNHQLNNNPLDCMDAIYKRYGDIVTVMSGSTPRVYVGNPLGIKQIFTNTKEITDSGVFFRDPKSTVGQQGIGQIDGLVHKHRRSILMKAYQGKRMEAFGERICELTKKIMSQQAIGKTFIAYETILKITLQVAIEVVIGLREGKRYEKIKHLCSSLIKYEDSLLLNIITQIPFSPWGYYNYLETEIFQFLYNEVQERRKQGDASRTDMLCDLIFACNETGEPLSNEEVRDLLFLPIIASRDGAAHSITWSLYWIHRSPGILDQLLSELDSLGENPDPMSIVALPYLSAVCNESLRIYPSALFMMPRLVEFPVEVMGYELIPGTTVIGNIYLTHQREDLYPEPKEFKPERFLEKKFSPYEFLPFGGGARNCIAGTFALFQMKLVLATILSRHQLALVNKRPERQRLLGDQCHPKSGVKMVVRGVRQYQERSQPLVSGLF
ncbi:MAG: cytochrome P450 [Nostoc sp. CreGUA01]|nr:cytochrome P450 [Nostoc sp. CreGUA01]